MPVIRLGRLRKKMEKEDGVEGESIDQEVF